MSSIPDTNLIFCLQSPCYTSPCKNNGTCEPNYSNGSFTCHCTEQFSGTYCTEGKGRN